MSRTVGIDLGTTNSVITVLTGGEPEVFANAEGSRTTPSVVAFGKNGDVLVGDVAKRQAVMNVDRTIASVKRHIGDPSWSVTVDGHAYSAEEVSSKILAKLKRDAEAYLCETVTNAVITVPAYFNDAQRQATKDAGAIAGLNVLRIVNEPTAAALAYGLDKGDKEQTILVFDLGGGTFDVSLLEMGGGIIQVKATSGDNHLGGDDWDQRVVDYLVHTFNEEHHIDLSTDQMAVQRLKEAAEQAKMELSSATTTTISLPYIAVGEHGTPIHLTCDLSRAAFEDMTADLLARCRIPFAAALSDAGMTVDGIDHVVLVGGSTRMPAVVNLVTELTGGREPNRGVNPDEVVAAGAALQGGVLAGEVKSVLLLDVTPLSLGIETGTGMMATLIERNTTIPARNTGVFTTAADAQESVSIKVYQGERPLARDNKQLGVFELTGLPPAPRGVPQIEVTFDIDANGIVNVSAKDTATGREQAIAVTGGSGLSKAEIARMIADAEVNEKQDAERRQVAEQLDVSRAGIAQVEKFVAGYGDLLPPRDRADLTDLLAAARDAADAQDLSGMRDSHESLMQAAQRAGSAMYRTRAGDGPGAPASGSEPASGQDEPGSPAVPPPPAWASA